MPVWRHLMWPFALLWGVGAWIRNRLYDSGFLNSAEFELPVISIGNLSMGGLGKTPHVEYFLYHFREMIRIAVLSRGYRRKTTGFHIAKQGDDYTLIGDEPRQMKSKFTNVVVAVGENRALAIPGLLSKFPRTQLIILDDAFQHRSVRPALNILLTPYANPFWKDFLFPVGWLRESRKNFKRADIIIVTKCPADLVREDEAAAMDTFQPLPHQKVFFSAMRYDTPYELFDPVNRKAVTSETTVLLFTGIANGEELRKDLAEQADEVFWMEFGDHFSYDERDVQTLAETYRNLDGPNKMIVTTEKDAVRLEPLRQVITREKLPIFCLPVRVEFTGSNRGEFDKLVLQYLNFYYRGGQSETDTAQQPGPAQS